MEILSYAKPGPEDRADVLDFMQQFYDAGETVVNGCGGLDFYKDYDLWLYHLDKIASGEEEGLVPNVIYLVRGRMGDVVGILDIRPKLPPEKLHFGHIGYSVAPPHRLRGYATQMAGWAVEALRREGVGNIYADCYEDNTASAKTLQNAGFTKNSRRTEEDSGKTIIEFINKLG